MMMAEPKRSWLQSAIHNLFAVWLGITPPMPGQELFYGGLLLALVLMLMVGGYFAVRLLMSQIMG